YSVSSSGLLLSYGSRCPWLRLLAALVAAMPARPSSLTCSRCKEIFGKSTARLAGLAPINNDSGKKRGTRHVEAGRTAIRRALYMAASVAMRANPILKAFSDRLRSKGYPFKYVVTAVMRKLIVILNAVLRDGQSWKGAQMAA